ncbi:MAG: MBL fold metallo-hydrolase [Gammaproteobacteria bacterium]|nr:MBL fold metallo-hydrolase [Gammaproteobacteria bacterium]
MYRARLLSALLLLLVSNGPWAATAVRDYPARQVSTHVWVIEGPLGYPSVENQGFMNNPAFVVTDKRVVVIDPGSSTQAGRMLIKQIRKVTDKPVSHVLDTHVHGDHWLGNQAVRDAYPNAVFIAHPEMIRRANDFAADRWLKIMEESTNGFTAGTIALVPDTGIEDGGNLRVDDIQFRVHAPGLAHSGTDIMIEVVEDRLMFLGDNVTYKRFPRLTDATFKGSINACDVALKSKARLYVPGHGPVGGKEVVEAYRDYLKKVYELSVRYYEEDMEDFEMKPRIVEALAPYSQWVNFEDEVGKHIGLAILEYEAEM